MAASYGASGAVAHQGTGHQVHASVSHAATPKVLSANGENVSLIRMPAETPRRMIGQASAAVLSQTMSAQCMAWAAASPSAHGSSPNTRALDLRSCSFNHFGI